MRKIVVILLFVVLGGCTETGADIPLSVRADDVPVEPGEFVVRRLTDAQYRNVVADLISPDIVVPARLEPDARSAGSLVRGSSQTTVSPRGVELYEAAAFTIAEQAVEDDAFQDRYLRCRQAFGSADCLSKFTKSFGRVAYRRPLTTDEMNTLVGIGRNASTTLDDPKQGVIYIIATILQSPSFLFRPEGATDREILNAFELASKLSFFLWNSAPDTELLALAETAELTKPDVLESQVDRMLADEKARRGVRAFFIDLYELDKLDELTKATEIFPHINDEVGPAAREETLKGIEYLVFEEQGDFRDIMTTRRTFVNRKLAAIYNMPAPAREGFAMTEYPEDQPRVGLLGQVSYLAEWSHPVSTSATLRGMFVQQKLLCRLIPNPPAGVDTSIPEPSGEAPTLRDRIQEHLQDPGCASCHNLTDHIGLGFENFDGLGRFRSTDDGTAIDASGEIDGIGFSNPVELASVVRNHPSFGPCLTVNLFDYANGRESADGERDLVTALADQFALSGYDFLYLMRAVALSEGFRTYSMGEVTQ